MQGRRSASCGVSPLEYIHILLHLRLPLSMVGEAQTIAKWSVKNTCLHNVNETVIFRMDSRGRSGVSQLHTSRSTPDVRCSLVINSDFTWKVHMYGKEVSTSLCGLLTNVSTIMREVNIVEAPDRELHLHWQWRREVP